MIGKGSLTSIATSKMNQKSILFNLLTEVDKHEDKYFKLTENIKKLLERGLVKPWSDGVFITEKGRQFMFQWQCENFLRSLQHPGKQVCPEEIEQWLIKHQFIVRTEVHSQWKITPRGREWLSQLE